jgi:threonine dehydrogenase-like Zn-dependent dehydrogenase
VVNMPLDCWFHVGDVKEVTVIGAHLGPYCWPKAIDMIASNKLPMERIISHRFPLDNQDEAINMVVDGQNSVKVMVIP